jgi:hypothetical protein
LHIGVLYPGVFDRDKIERLLLRFPQSLSITETGTFDEHFIAFDVKNFSFVNTSETMLSTGMHILPKEHLSFAQKYRDIACFDGSFSDILFRNCSSVVIERYP